MAIVHARAGRDDAAEALQTALVLWSADAPELPVRAVVTGVATAMHAYAREDWAHAADVLETLQAQFVPLGGSRAQIDVVRRTQIAACRHAGRDARAQALAFERPHTVSAA